MSTRQIRRLQNIVRASIGADADDDEYYPSTMRLPKSSGKSKAQRKTAGKELPDCQGGGQELRESVTANSVGASPLPPGRSGASDDSDQKLTKAGVTNKATTRLTTEDDRMVDMTEKDASPDTRNNGQRQAHQRDQRKKRQCRRNKARRREEELEEERLLEAVLRERERDATDTTLCLSGHVSGEGAEDLLELLSLCNPKMLNGRLERIRRFGPSAVEDLGSGRTPVRRMESRRTSQLFEEHPHQLPRFRSSVLATPNRYCWPRYDGLGTRLVMKESKFDDDTCAAGRGADRPKVYFLDVSAAESQRADAGLAECEARVGAVDDLMKCLGRAPYHIPTLLVASNVFETMGSLPRALEVIELALYHLGVLLVFFPLRETARRRCLPFSIPSNRQVFQVLRCGIHHALRNAAVGTAWEISKLLYSLDPKDPFGMLLLLDYLALRSKGWAWLVHVYYLLTQHPHRGPDPRVLPPTTERMANASESLSNRELALSLSTLPGFFFSAALAKLFLEREHESHEKDGGRLSRVIRDMSPAELHAFHNTPPSTTILADSIGRFPSAAVLLVEKVGSQAQTIPFPAAWKEVVKVHSGNHGGRSLRVATLWVARSAEMWNAAEPSGLLRRAITEGAGLYLESLQLSVANPCDDVPTPWEHEMLREEDLMGTVVAAIPAHLLDPNEITAEDVREQGRRANTRALTPLEEDMLLRFTALYGELPESVGTPAEQLTVYEMLFEADGREREMVRQQSHISLFFRTFLPWNNTLDIALRDALRAAGIDDPVAERNRRRRQEEVEADQFSNVSGWTTESSWETEELSLSSEAASDDDDVLL